MKLLLLLCLLNYSGTTPISVIGKKGSGVTLPCEHEARDIFHINLISRSKDIPVCQKKNCTGRMFKEGSCDIIIKDLMFSDAGKYFLHIYYNNDQSELKRLIRTYHLHIQDELSVKRGEKVKMAVLWSNAYKVVLQRKISTEWTEVWTRDGDEVQSDRLSNIYENLIINNFTSTDTGTYRVLDSEGQILITLTLTELGLTEKQNRIAMNSKTDDTKKRNHWGFFGAVVLFGLALAVLITLAVQIKKMQ